MATRPTQNTYNINELDNSDGRTRIWHETFNGVFDNESLA